MSHLVCISNSFLVAVAAVEVDVDVHRAPASGAALSALLPLRLLGTITARRLLLAALLRLRRVLCLLATLLSLCLSGRRLALLHLLDHLSDLLDRLRRSALA